ncbi:MAG TPA: DNA internalization-related competence protein ComEC/Rec2 [Candidatus Polarisedimenticolaceae bacterium]|nr:DNA internalization-related competence protein ComEC/Rec2 [Candidatus Polarisedimenticolaceae bacterium]
MPPRRPAIAPCAAFVVGAFVGLHGVGQAPLLPGALSALALLLALGAHARAPRLASFAVCASLAGAGAALSLAERSESAARLATCFPDGQRSIELDFSGRVIAIAEPTFEGERLLLLAGRGTGRAGSCRLTVKLRIGRSPDASTRVVDRLDGGDRVRVWCRLTRPRGLANRSAEADPSEPPSGGVDAWGSVKSARLVVLDGPGRAGVDRATGRLKREARRRLDLLLGPNGETRALAGAMLLGDRAMLHPNTQRSLRDSGLFHLCAISGLHVGIVMLLSIALIERSRLSRPTRVLLALALLYGFGQFVGLRASVARATLAAAAAQAGRLFDRTGDPLNTLCWIAALLVGCSPPLVGDLGFQLSATATAGILLALSPKVRVSPLRVSAAAYLATVPLTAFHFGWVAPVALVANLVAVPLCTFVLGSGYLALLGCGVPFVGPLAGRISEWSGEAMLGFARAVSTFEPGAFPVARPAAAVVAAFYFLAVAWAVARLRDARPTACRLLGCAGAVCLAWIHLGPPPPATRELAAAVIDVGQGQAVIARVPGGGSLLVDAGGSHNRRFDPGERVVLPFVLGFAGRRIEHLVLSHDHLDHVGGAAAIVDALEVGSLCLPPGFARSTRMKRLADTVVARGGALRLCIAGVRLVGERAVVLAPPRVAWGTSVNDRSVVIRIGSPGHRLLVPGDLERAGEHALVHSAVSLTAEALVLSHHGSRTGSTRALLDRVAPRAALISCGHDNRFGHPHAETIERVRVAPVTLWRTDLDGAIQLRESSGGWSIRATRR